MGDLFVDSIRSIPIEEYAVRVGLDVKKINARWLTLASHDSMRIDTTKNAFWWNSRGLSGGVIDFVMAVENCDVPTAMRILSNMFGIERGKSVDNNFLTQIEKYKKQNGKKDEIKKLVYPERAENNKRAWCYLHYERNIHSSVLRYFISKDMLYQDVRNNCVFKTDKFACIRSTGARRFAVDAKGCDYNECFYFEGKKEIDTLIVTEAVIDTMSIMSLMCDNGYRYNNYAYLALTGTSKIESIFYHISQNKNISKVVLALDNDDAGIGACEEVKKRMESEYPNICCFVKIPESEKDWNGYLQKIKKGCKSDEEK